MTRLPLAPNPATVAGLARPRVYGGGVWGLFVHQTSTQIMDVTSTRRPKRRPT
jgi:hypothetical protein